MKIGIIGNGLWGTALGAVLNRAGHSVVFESGLGYREVWQPNAAAKIRAETPVTIRDADVWIMATPSDFFRKNLMLCSGEYNNQPIVMCAKGIETDTDKTLLEIVQEVIPGAPVVVFTGPQFADEVQAGMPTGSLLAGSASVRDIVRQLFSEFYLEESDDIIGAEIAGAGKNAVSVVYGYCKAKLSSRNEIAMMTSRAWSEVIAVGLAMGADAMTFNGLAGFGDLFLSAANGGGRNYAAGVAMAQGVKIVGTVEGLTAMTGLVNIGKKLNIDTPVLGGMLKKIK